MELTRTVFAGLLVAGCILGAGMDIVARRIPNGLCLALLIAGLGYAAWFGSWSALLSHAGFAAIALAVGAGLFGLRWIGAGDAKFFAGGAAWFSFEQAPLVLIAVSGAGLGLLLVWFVYRRIRGRKISRRDSPPHDQLPYGVAIALGVLAAFAQIA